MGAWIGPLKFKRFKMGQTEAKKKEDQAQVEKSARLRKEAKQRIRARRAKQRKRLAKQIAQHKVKKRKKGVLEQAGDTIGGFAKSLWEDITGQTLRSIMKVQGHNINVREGRRTKN